MESDEANTSEQPRDKSDTNHRATKKTGFYMFAISILFFLIIALCIDNLMIYKSFVSSQGNYIIAFQRVKTIIEDKQNLNEGMDRLLNENKTLIDKYNMLANQDMEIQKQVQVIKKQNEELVKKNKELIEDNIALQNSIKAAASAGIKPQNYTRFEGLTYRGDIERGRFIGDFLGTAYTPSIEECGNNNGITNSGKPVIPGISIAIDNNYWPFGTVFYIRGLGYAVAMDTGNKIKGKNRFDFAVFDKDFAYALGSKMWPVYLVKLGDGDVDEIKF